MTRPRLTAAKLDFDRLHDEAVAAGRYGICPLCEEAASQLDEPERSRPDFHWLCWCGVCLANCHDSYAHEGEAEPY